MDRGVSLDVGLVKEARDIGGKLTDDVNGMGSIRIDGDISIKETNTGLISGI